MILEKQIEEMAKVMHERCREISEDTEGIAKLEAQGKTMPDDFAEVLYNAGYRKATDVAEEIFAEIQAEIKAALDSNYKALPQVEMSEELWSCVRGKIDCLRGLDDFIDELKKKWEVEG